MSNKSFRIRNYENELATVFPIGMGEFFTVAWDNEAPDTQVYSKKEIDEALADGYMVKLEDSLPRSFKFKCNGWPYEYDYTRGKGYRYLHNGVYGDYNYHSESRAIECIKSGEWIVLPSEPEVRLPEGISCETLEAYKAIVHNLGEALGQPEVKIETDFTRTCIDKLNSYTGCMSYNDSYFGEPEGELKRVIRQLDKAYTQPENKLDISTLQLKIEIDGVKEAYELLDEMVAKSNTALESIKDFTSGTGHDVFISEGIYKVYRKGEDMPYVCHSDEQVVAVMDALIVLDSADVE